MATLALDPSGSNLPQLASFPVLVSNLLAWSQEFAPVQAGAGEAALVEQPPGPSATTVTATAAGGGERRLAHSPLELSQPGIYPLTQRGSWGERSQTIAVNAGTAAQSSPTGIVELSGPPPVGAQPARRGGRGCSARPWSC